MTVSPPHPAQRRYPSLDLLRLVAITLTILVHTPRLASRVPGLGALQGGFWLGVDLFMLISGWLLGAQLLRGAAQGAIDPLRFYVKRWMRTLPPYLVMLGVLQLLGASMRWGTLLAHATFLQMYLGNNQYLVSWSLCVEEHFYLLLPLLVLGLTRRPRLGTLVALVAFVEAVAVVSRAVTFTPQESVPCLTHMRWHGLFIGMAFAWIHQHRPALWKSLGRWATGLAVIGVVTTILVMISIPDGPSRWRYIGAPTVGTWTLALAFLACVHEASPLSRISFPGLQYLGELTYAVYLTHDIWPRSVVDAHGAPGSLLGFAWRLGLVLGSAVVLHHLVEWPALRLRERLLDRWRAAPAVPLPERT